MSNNENIDVCSKVAAKFTPSFNHRFFFFLHSFFYSTTGKTGPSVARELQPIPPTPPVQCDCSPMPSPPPEAKSEECPFYPVMCFSFSPH